jgi:hypothetical protein
MTDITSPAGSISSPDNMPSISSIGGTFSTNLARDYTKDYAEKELPSDTTSRVLSAFLDHLPSDSSEVIADDITVNSKNLQKLATPHISAILIPSKSPDDSGLLAHVHTSLSAHI